MAKPSEQPGWFFLLNFMFIMTGVTQSLQSFAFDRNGINSFTGLAASGNVVGSVLCMVWWPSVRKAIDWSKTRSLFLICCGDVMGAVFMQVSIAIIGSGLYTVIYSFVVVYIAMVNRFIYHKPLSWLRWFAVVMLSLFIGLSAFGSLQVPDVDIALTIFGLFAALLATVGYGTMYIKLNHVFETNVVSNPWAVCLQVGLINSLVFLMYICIAAVPRWTEWVTDPVQEADENWSEDFYSAMIASYLLICGIHQLSFYNLMTFGPQASTSGGVAKSLQAVLLFYFSDWMFCSVSETQCLNEFKNIGTFGVCITILLYTFDEKLLKLIGLQTSQSSEEYSEHVTHDSHERLPSLPPTPPTKSINQPISKGKQPYSKLQCPIGEEPDL